MKFDTSYLMVCQERALSKTKQYLLPIAVLIFLGAYYYVLEERHVPSANSESCAVYAAAYRHLAAGDDEIYFSEITISFDSSYRETSPYAPAIFHIYTDETELVELTPSKVSVETPVRSSFEHDTSAYIEPVSIDDPRRINACFEGFDKGPKSHAGDFESLLNMAKSNQRSGNGSEEPGLWLTLLHVSPVGFSDDGEWAAIYTEQHCGGLCGWGGFALFKKVDEEWEFAGDHTIWVS